MTKYLTVKLKNVTILNCAFKIYLKQIFKVHQTFCLFCSNSVAMFLIDLFYYTFSNLEKTSWNEKTYEKKLTVFYEYICTYVHMCAFVYTVYVYIYTGCFTARPTNL